MADRIIKLRIDVTKIDKSTLFKSDKTGSVYLDATVLFNEEPDQYGSNGMIVQDVPKSVYEKEKDKPAKERTKGAILGNCKDWSTQKSERNTESIPGGNNKQPVAQTAQEAADDLPF